MAHPDQPTQPVGLRCVTGQGLRIEDARALRVDVQDGAVRVRRPGRPPEVVGSVGTLTSAVWLDPDRTRRLLGRPRSLGGALVLAAGEEVVLTFPVATSAPWSSDLSQQRESSGAVGLVRSLGLVLEAARESDVPSRKAFRAALVDAQPSAPRTGPVALGLTLLAGVLAFLSMPAGESWTGLVLSGASLATIVPVLALLVRQRQRFERLVAAPPDPEGRAVYRLPEETVGRLPTHLQLGPADVVLVDGAGQETWLPGPAAGGVASCVVGDTDTALLDAAGTPLLVLQTAQVAPDDQACARLAQAAERAGIAFGRDPLAGFGGTSYDLAHHSGHPDVWMSDWERGRLGSAVHVLVPLTGLLHLLGAVVLAGGLSAWAWLLVPCSLTWLGVWIWSELRFRRWRRHVVRSARALPAKENA